MCCRVTIEPLDKPTALAILAIGQFANDSAILGDDYWHRDILSEGTTVKADISGDQFTLALSPTVSSMDGHEHKREAASVMFEIAARYAEKVNGVIRQTSINVSECMTENMGSRTLAVYPSTRFDFKMLCAGFRKAFMGETE